MKLSVSSSGHSAKFLDELRRNTANERLGLNIPCDDSSGRNSGAASHAHTWEDDSASADPAVSLDDYGLGVRRAADLLPRSHVDGVGAGAVGDVKSDEGPVPDPD